MKIVILIYSLHGGGAERAASALADWWAGSGHQVTILLYGDVESGFSLAGNVKIESLGGPGGQGVLAVLGRVRRIRSALDKLGPDVAVGMMSTANVLLALASLGRPWRTVGAERASPAWHPHSKIWRWLRALTYPLLDGVVAQTSEAATWLRKHAHARTVQVIPNAIVWPLVETDETAGARPPAGARRMLLAAGRLVPQKGFVDLVQAFSGPARAHPDWDLYILGEGPERKAIEAEVTRLNLTNRVLLPGQTGAMAAWYQAADLFVLSSLFEGFPNVVLEAMAAGLPVVSRDCPEGPADIIRNGVDGILAPVENMVDFTAALDHMMSDAALRARFADRAREVRERFSKSVIMAHWDLILVPSDGRLD